MGRLAFAARSLTCLRCTSGARRSAQGLPRGGDRGASRDLAPMPGAGVDSIVVLDSHWLVNAGYHVNCGERFKGVYTSNELPHFIRDMAYDYPNASSIASAANAQGIRTRARDGEPRARVRDARSDALHERRPALPRRLGSGLVRMARPRHEPAVLRAGRGDRAVGHDRVFASGSLSHRFNDDGSPEESIFRSAEVLPPGRPVRRSLAPG